MSTTLQLEISYHVPDSNWDSFVASVAGGRHFQTSLWMQVKQESGWQSVRIVVLENGRIIGGTQLLLRQYPLVGAFAYISRGPLFSKHETRVHEVVIEGILEVIKKERIQFVLVQPPCCGEAVIETLRASNFQPTTLLRVAPTATMLVDLTRELDVIEESFHKRTRRYIRAAQNKGIEIYEGDANDVETYYHMLKEKAERKEWSIFHYNYYTMMWQILSSENRVRLTFARYEGNIIGALLVYAYGEGIYGKTNITLPAHANSGASELLLYEAFQWGKQQGYQYFDLAIVDPSIAQQMQSGEFRLKNVQSRPAFFKYRMGGKPTFCPQAYIYIKNPLLKFFYHRIFTALISTHIGRRVRDKIRGLRIMFGNRNRT